MERARELLRSGDWLTRERMRLVALAVLIASAAGFLYLIVTAHGLVDFQGRPLGTDFSNVYAAGTYVRDGDPEAPFDLSRQHAREQQIFGDATPFYGWHYPPFFLFVAAALALMPYGVALAVWQAVTFGLYLLTIWAIIGSSFRGAQSAIPESIATALPRSAPSRVDDSSHGTGAAADPLWLLLAVAFPAVLINIGHGQNGFLTAALIGGALVMLDRRPLLAGVLFGLLAYKPQFGLMVPLVLAVSGRWRCFAAAAATVALLALATTAAFGPQIWHAFLNSTRFTRLVALEQGNTGWYKIQSVFSWARMWGASIPLAYMFQGALAAALAAALVAVWRGAAPYRAQGGGALPRCDPRDALHLRLRHGGARACHRLPRRRRIRARVPTVGEDGAGHALDGAARGAQCHTSDTCSFRRCGDARNVYSLVAAHHERFHLAAGFL